MLMLSHHRGPPLPPLSPTFTPLSPHFPRCLREGTHKSEQQISLFMAKIQLHVCVSQPSPLVFLFVLAICFGIMLGNFVWGLPPRPSIPPTETLILVPRINKNYFHFQPKLSPNSVGEIRRTQGRKTIWTCTVYFLFRKVRSNKRLENQ